MRDGVGGRVRSGENWKVEWEREGEIEWGIVIESVREGVG